MVGAKFMPEQKKEEALIDFLHVLDDSSYTLSDFMTACDEGTLPNKPYDVRAFDYAKRIESLIYHLPETVVSTIQTAGYMTPGLKGSILTKEDFVNLGIDKKWYGIPFEQMQFPIQMEDKLTQLERFKKEAYSMIPLQEKWKEKDVERAFEEHYQAIFDALAESTQQEIVRINHQERDEKDLLNLYV